ncbi:aif1 [Symbiodinium sp. KB8]|nr:aif1 [Symbiodinium sp. KB8]
MDIRGFGCGNCTRYGPRVRCRFRATGSVKRNGYHLAGTMKEVQVEPGNDASTVLLVHTAQDKWFATSAKCTHYGAPLAKGTLVGDRVVCPWHGACFSCASGDIEDAPALDGLHTYEVCVEGGDVLVENSGGWPSTHRREVGLAVRDPANTKRAVIVGGGAAGAVAAQSLREGGFTGEVVLVTAEEHLPYDRVKLSKGVGVDVESVLLRDAAWYDAAGVDVRRGVRVASVDVGSRTLVMEGGSTERYDALLLATGSEARRLPIEGGDLEGVHTLRGVEDAGALAGSVGEGGDKDVVCVGGSFISVEYAAALAAKGTAKSVSVLGIETVPFERVLGKEVGGLVLDLVQSKGINMYMEAAVTSLSAGSDGRVSQVHLKDGTALPADVVVLGVGAKPVLPVLGGAAVHAVQERGGVATNPQLEVCREGSAESVPGVWAAGDVACVPGYLGSTSLTRIEHWDVAQQQGRVAGKNMATFLASQPAAAGSGEGAELQRAPDSVPFFWTALAGIGNIRYAGAVLDGYDEVIFEGGKAPSAASPEFVAYYAKGDAVVAVATLGRDPVSTDVRALLAAGTMPCASQLKSGAATSADFSAMVAALP